MRGSTLIGVALHSILENKMRTLLTMLGIIIGVGAVIVMVAIGQGAQSKIQEQVNNLGTNMIVVTPGTSSQGGVHRGPRVSTALPYGMQKRFSVRAFWSPLYRRSFLPVPRSLGARAIGVPP